MHALLSLLFTLLVAANPTAPQAGPAGNPPPNVVAVAYADCLDFFLLLDDPDVKTQIVGVKECGALALVTAVHTASALSWGAVYTFPATIYAHSVVSVSFHAEEMK